MNRNEARALEFACDASVSATNQVTVGIVPGRGQRGRYQVRATGLLSPAERERSDLAEWYGVLLVIARHLGRPVTIWTDCTSAAERVDALKEGINPAGSNEATAIGSALTRLVTRAVREYPVEVQWVTRNSPRLRIAHNLSRGDWLSGSSPQTVWRYLARSPAWQTPEMLPVLADRYQQHLPINTAAIHRRMLSDPG